MIKCISTPILILLHDLFPERILFQFFPKKQEQVDKVLCEKRSPQRLSIMIISKTLQSEDDVNLLIRQIHAHQICMEIVRLYILFESTKDVTNSPFRSYHILFY